MNNSDDEEIEFPSPPPEIDGGLPEFPDAPSTALDDMAELEARLKKLNPNSAFSRERTNLKTFAKSAPATGKKRYL